MSVTLEQLESRLQTIFVARVRAIDGALADIVQRHLDEGYSLSTVHAMLTDANAIVSKEREQQS